MSRKSFRNVVIIIIVVIFLWMLIITSLSHPKLLLKCCPNRVAQISLVTFSSRKKKKVSSRLEFLLLGQKLILDSPQWQNLSTLHLPNSCLHEIREAVSESTSKCSHSAAADLSKSSIPIYFFFLLWNSKHERYEKYRGGDSHVAGMVQLRSLIPNRWYQSSNVYSYARVIFLN